MRLTWIADVLRAAGLTVVEVDGWKTRGAEYSSTPLAVICHETQGSATSSVQGELNVLINGRTGLAGPIAQLMIDRKGVWYVVASGRCNQVKTGVAGPLKGKGNSYSFGVEAMHAVSEDWTRKPAQYASYVAGVAAICKRMGWQPDVHVIGHKEHQPGDKSDPEFSMPAFRAAVAGDDGDGDDMLSKKGETGDKVRFLQLALQRLDGTIWPVKDGVPQVTNTYDSTTVAAVKRLLGGNGEQLNPELYVRLLMQLARVAVPPAKDGKDGTNGTNGRDGVVPDGAVFVLQSPVE